MYKKAIEVLSTLNEPIELVSGGAAWADHLAVNMFLDDLDTINITGLTLFLPAAFDLNSAQYVEQGFRSAGSVANYYHRKFSTKMCYNTMEEIVKAAQKGADLNDLFKGFHNRNIQVGKSDFILAFTWGEGDVPKDGGTKHTWDNSKAKKKLHISLKTLPKT
jgi:hypothetical protein